MASGLSTVRHSFAALPDRLSDCTAKLRPTGADGGQQCEPLPLKPRRLAVRLSGVRYRYANL